MKERFENTPDLFGRGLGISTCGDFTCGICGEKYNEGNDEAEDYDGDSVMYTNFAGIDICFDCFIDVENEILKRMSDILPWYKRLLFSQKDKLDNYEHLLKSLFGQEPGNEKDL